MTTTTCPCNEARLLAEKANEQAQRALHDLHHTTVKGLQEALSAAHAENERLRTQIGTERLAWETAARYEKERDAALKSCADLAKRYDSAMEQIRDAHGALTTAGVPSEKHTSHEGCATQLGHRVRELAARAVDPDEYYEVRVQIDHKVGLQGTFKENIRTAWHDGYQRGVEDQRYEVRAIIDELRAERDGRKAQQFRVETAIVNAYMEAFPDWAYAGPEEAMRVFVRELQGAQKDSAFLLARYRRLLHAVAVLWQEYQRMKKTME